MKFILVIIAMLMAFAKQSNLFMGSDVAATSPLESRSTEIVRTVMRQKGKSFPLEFHEEVRKG
jgi:hypothetical protein